MPAAFVSTLTKPVPDFTFPLPCFFPVSLVGHASNRVRSHKRGLRKMGRHQTEAAYLKSVLLWLQGNWAEPDPPRFYPLKEVEQGSRYYSARRNRRDVIFEQPAFLPARSASARPRGG